MALIFSAFFESLSIPLSEKSYSSNSRLDFTNLDLFSFSVRPFARSCSKNLGRFALCS